jgi:TusE/DsrC/DsvC family sulfur relay protein
MLNSYVSTTLISHYKGVEIMDTYPNTQQSPGAGVPPPVFDEDGFLQDPDLWTPELAQRIATLEGLGTLGEDHWKIITYVRERYLRYGSLPVLRQVCRASGLDRDVAYQLFHGCRGLWRTAGLPHPGEEAKAYMS